MSRARAFGYSAFARGRGEGQAESPRAPQVG